MKLMYIWIKVTSNNPTKHYIPLLLWTLHILTHLILSTTQWGVYYCHPVHRWNWGTERLNNLPDFTPLIKWQIWESVWLESIFVTMSFSWHTLKYSTIKLIFLKKVYCVFPKILSVEKTTEELLNCSGSSDTFHSFKLLAWHLAFAKGSECRKSCDMPSLIGPWPLATPNHVETLVRKKMRKSRKARERTMLRKCRRKKKKKLMKLPTLKQTLD